MLLMSFSRAVSVVLIFSGVGPILRNEREIWGQKACYIAPAKSNISWETLQEISIKYKLS